MGAIRNQLLMLFQWWFKVKNTTTTLRPAGIWISSSSKKETVDPLNLYLSSRGAAARHRRPVPRGPAGSPRPQRARDTARPALPSPRTACLQMLHTPLGFLYF